MDFHLQINEETKTFDQYHQAIEFLMDKIASWNNFNPDQPFYVKLTKIENDTETLGINTKESVRMKDRMA